MLKVSKYLGTKTVFLLQTHQGGTDNTLEIESKV